jgi:hypothetical protein
MSSAAGDATLAAGGDREALRQALEGLAARASRTLSSRAQARLELSLVDLDRTGVSALCAKLGPLDRAVALVTAADDVAAFVLPSRELAFALLALRFGAAQTALETPLPTRPYTRIEERALEATALELWRALGTTGIRLARDPVRAGGLEDAARLQARADDPLWLANFSVDGLAAPASLWLAVASPPQRARAQDFISGGNDAIEADHDLDTEGASAPSQPPHPHAAPVAAAGLSLAAHPAERALWIGRGTTVEVGGDRAGGSVLRLDGRVVAHGTLAAGASHPVLRIERVVDAPSDEGRDAG